MANNVRIIKTIVHNKEDGKMFDMQKVGRNISTLRKKANMTQMELADRLGISFQAVSNWERGNTMPDISKLGELSEMLGCTIDELLGNERAAKVVQSFEKGDIPEDLTKEDFEEVVPLLRPQQADRAFLSIAGLGDLGRKIKDSIDVEGLSALGENIAKNVTETVGKSLEGILGALGTSEEKLTEPEPPTTPKPVNASESVSVPKNPAVSEQIENASLRERILKKLSSFQGISPEKVQENLEHEYGDELEEHLEDIEEELEEVEANESSTEPAPEESKIGGFNFSDIATAAPFLSDDLVDDLARRMVKEDVNIKNLAAIAPFVSEEVLNELARELIGRDCKISELARLAPFLDEETISELAQAAEFIGEDFSPILPFLNEEDIDTLALKQFEKDRSVSKIAKYAPFMSEKTLASIAIQALDIHGISAIMPIMPFIDSDEISRRIREKLK